MNTNYFDILALTDQKPLWFDENAVPRFAPFQPNMAANIYAKEICLFEIKCQSCGHLFKVVRSWDRHDKRGALSELIKRKIFGYGDPPNIDCCGGGPSMMSETVKILEFWQYDDLSFHNWVENYELEKTVFEECDVE